MLAILVALAVAINRRRRHGARELLGDAMGVDAEGPSMEAAVDVLKSPAAWVVIFIGMILAGAGTVVLVLDGADVLLVAVVLVVGLVGYLAIGSYSLARNRGHSSAMSFLESVTILGLLAVLAAITHLVFIS